MDHWEPFEHEIDIVIEREGFRVYIPIAASVHGNIVISVRLWRRHK